MYPKPTWWYKKCSITPKRCLHFGFQIHLHFIMWKSIVEFLLSFLLVECADRLQNNNYSWFSTWFSKKDHFIIHVFKHVFLTYKILYRLVKCINRLYIQLLIAKCCRIISTAVPTSAESRGSRTGRAGRTGRASRTGRTQSQYPCSSRSTQLSSELAELRAPTVYTLQFLCYEPKRGSEIFRR